MLRKNRRLPRAEVNLTAADLERANQLLGENSAEPWTARAYPIQLRQLMFEHRYGEIISKLRPLLPSRASAA